MRRKFPRWSVAPLLVGLGAASPAVGMTVASQPQAGAQQQGQQPLSSLDREFVTVIRFANLWEIPMGRLATKRGASRRVREVGKVLAEDHTKLDVTVKQLAGRSAVRLPDRPTSSQRDWMADIQSRTGEAFDNTFVDRLRAAHGTVFGLVAEVRAGTRNTVIRGFAQQANVIVMKHMTLPESTGHVSAAHGMFAEAVARQFSYPENKATGSDPPLAGLVMVLMAGVTIAVVRTFSGQGAAE